MGQLSFHITEKKTNIACGGHINGRRVLQNMFVDDDTRKYGLLISSFKIH
jgi:hypothetical protein